MDHQPKTFAKRLEQVASLRLALEARRSRARPAALLAGGRGPPAAGLRWGPSNGVAPSGGGPSRGAGHWLRCECGWTVECLGADRERFVRCGCPLCGAILAAGPAGPNSADARRWPRRPPRAGARVAVWTGPPGGRQDRAVALADVCTGGAGVLLASPVRVGELVGVLLTAPPAPPTELAAEVRWCAPGLGGTYRAGLSLLRPLTDRAVDELVG
jgi:PilZ domain